MPRCLPFGINRISLRTPSRSSCKYFCLGHPKMGSVSPSAGRRSVCGYVVLCAGRPACDFLISNMETTAFSRANTARYRQLVQRWLGTASLRLHNSWFLYDFSDALGLFVLTLRRPQSVASRSSKHRYEVSRQLKTGLGRVQGKIINFFVLLRSQGSSIFPLPGGLGPGVAGTGIRINHRAAADALW